MAPIIAFTRTVASAIVMTVARPGDIRVAPNRPEDIKVLPIVPFTVKK